MNALFLIVESIGGAPRAHSSFRYLVDAAADRWLSTNVRKKSEKILSDLGIVDLNL